jgi:hypothetical protein
VRLPSGNETALKEAVYSRGPVAVSIDASQPTFRFYSGGVYSDPNCAWKVEDLDHSVLLGEGGSQPDPYI